MAKVKDFKYLGSTVQSNGECGSEVEKRVQAGWNGWRRMSGVICNRRVPTRVKGKVYKVAVRPAMLYGLERVALTKRQEAEMEVAELNHHHSSLGSRCVPWLGEGISMLSPNYPVLCFPLPYCVAPVFVQVVSPSLGWSPLSSFLVIWSPTGDTRGPSVVFEAVDMPCPGPFHFSYSVDYIYDFCPLPDPDVGLSVFVCDVEHTSFHFCLCGRKFVLCLFGQCPCLCTICHSWQHTGVVHLSL